MGERLRSASAKQLVSFYLSCCVFACVSFQSICPVFSGIFCRSGQRAIPHSKCSCGCAALRGARRTTARCPGVATLNVSWLQLIKGRMLILSHTRVRCDLELQRHRNWTPHCVRMGCQDVSEVDRLQNHTGVAVLAVLTSSQVLQATPHIVGLKPGILGTRILWS